MRHFSCDLCGKELVPGAETRFVVRMESFAVAEPAGLTEADLDRDHVETMAEILEELEETGSAPSAPPAGQKMEYDLCQGCHRKFAANPLGREAARKLRFSKN